MATKTKIIDAVLELVSATLDNDDYIAIGRAGETRSIKTKLSSLQAWLNVTLDKIEEGDSKVEVVDESGSGYVVVQLDGNAILWFYPTSIYPQTNNSVDLGSATKAFKDLHIRGGIDVGSDATGDIYYRDASGVFQRLEIGIAGQTLVSTGTIPSWGTADIDFVPNYFVTDLEGLIDAITEINLSSTAKGGNIYITGTILMDDNYTWNLTNIRFYGNEAYWVDRDLDSTTVAPVLADKGYTVTISAGSPTFDNIMFKGTVLGLTSYAFSSYDTRELFILSNTSNAQDITFTNCTFGDVIGGSGSGNAVISFSKIPANSASVVRFENCTISSHNYNENTPFTYDGFTIEVIGAYDGYLYVYVNNQIFNNRAFDNNYSSTTYKLITSGATVDANAECYIKVDESAQVNIASASGTTVRTPVSEVPELKQPISSDLVLVADSTDNYIMKKTPLEAFGIVKSEVRLDYEDIRGLGTAITLIAAPGSDKTLDLVDVTYKINVDDAISLTTETIDIYYSGFTSGVLASIPNADIISVGSTHKRVNVADAIALKENTAIVVRTSGGTNPTTVDSVSNETYITFFLTYTISEDTYVGLP